MLYLLFENLREWLTRTGLYSYVMVLDRVTFRALAAALLAFVGVLAAGRPLIGWLRRKKIGDSGITDAEALRRHSASKANVPTMGGVMISSAILASTLLLADVTNFYVVLGIVVVVWLTALGSVDDWLKLTAASRPGGSRQGLYAWEKLVFQLGLGVLVGWFAYNHGDATAGPDLAHVVNLPFQKTYETANAGAPTPGLAYLTRGMFVVWCMVFLTGMSNAVNITDGMDGLAAGTTAAVSVGLLVLTVVGGTQVYSQFLLVPHVSQSDELSILAGAMAGASLGFLWWNCSPAQVFMGDTGSLSLGGLAAYLAVIVRQEALLICMSVVFVVEIASVVIQVGYFKATKGKRVFKCAPYHHHLHLCGWTEQQVVARAWIVSVLAVLMSLATVKLR